MSGTPLLRHSIRRKRVGQSCAGSFSRLMQLSIRLPHALARSHLVLAFSSEGCSSNCICMFVSRSKSFSSHMECDERKATGSCLIARRVDFTVDGHLLFFRSAVASLIFLLRRGLRMTSPHASPHGTCDQVVSTDITIVSSVAAGSIL